MNKNEYNHDNGDRWLKCFLVFVQVMIIAHVPPGKFEKHRNYHWYYDYYNWQFVKLLQKHGEVIGSVHMAHHHTDSFRLVWDKENKGQ